MNVTSTHKYHQTNEQIASEESILRNAIKNPEAFAPIYNKYFLPIFKFTIQRTENEQIAAEITNNIFAKALFNLKKYNFQGLPFSSWLFRVASNEITDYYRTQKRNRTVNIPDENFEIIQEEPEDLEDQTLLQQKLISILPTLSPDDVTLIEMRFFEGRAFKEIGEILEMITDHARVKTHRAIAALRKKLLKK